LENENIFFFCCCRMVSTPSARAVVVEPSEGAVEPAPVS